MNQRHLAGIGARLVTFLQDLQAAAENIFPYLPEGDRPLADFDQFIRPVKGLPACLRLESEKLGKTDRYTVKNALQRTDGWVGGVGFDQRNRRIGDTGTSCQFPLGNIMAQPQMPQTSAYIHRHARAPVALVRNIENPC
ncbi:hypothetical protein D3C78_1369450 [compost metagenome]